MNPTTARTVTRLRNGRYEVQTPGSEIDFPAVQTVRTVSGVHTAAH